MDAKTLAALKDSIAHWERMTADPKCGEEPSGKECALCTLFVIPGKNRCLGCPVHTRSGKTWCGNTPYGDARLALRVVIDGAPYTPERRAAMQAEVDFLKSLLPEEEEQG